MSSTRTVREAFAFTLSDAWGGLPITLAIFGFFLGSLLILYFIKWVFEWIFLRRQQPGSYVLQKCEKCKDRKKLYWKDVPHHSYGSIVHLIIETLFFCGIIVAAMFSAAVGNVNLWQSNLANVGIAAIATYVFGVGFQLFGSGLFFYLTNPMAYEEYWELVGQNIEGRVYYITPFYIYLGVMDPKSETARLIRVSQTQVINGNWSRDYNKELTAPIAFRWNIRRQKMFDGDEYSDEYEEEYDGKNKTN